LRKEICGAFSKSGEIINEIVNRTNVNAADCQEEFQNASTNIKVKKKGWLRTLKDKLRPDEQLKKIIDRIEPYVIRTLYGAPLHYHLRIQIDNLMVALLYFVGKDTLFVKGTNSVAHPDQLVRRFKFYFGRKEDHEEKHAKLDRVRASLNKIKENVPKKSSNFQHITVSAKKNGKGDDGKLNMSYVVEGIVQLTTDPEENECIASLGDIHEWFGLTKKDGYCSEGSCMKKLRGVKHDTKTDCEEAEGENGEKCEWRYQPTYNACYNNCRPNTDCWKPYTMNVIHLDEPMKQILEFEKQIEIDSEISLRKLVKVVPEQVNPPYLGFYSHHAECKLPGSWTTDTGMDDVDDKSIFVEHHESLHAVLKNILPLTLEEMTADSLQFQYLEQLMTKVQGSPLCYYFYPPEELESCTEQNSQNQTITIDESFFSPESAVKTKLDAYIAKCVKDEVKRQLQDRQMDPSEPPSDDRRRLPAVAREPSVEQSFTVFEWIVIIALVLVFTAFYCMMLNNRAHKSSRASSVLAAPSTWSERVSRLL